MKFDKYLKLIAPIAAILSLASAGLILYFINKYGVNDSEIERVPAGKEGKRYVYRIR